MGIDSFSFTLVNVSFTLVHMALADYFRKFEGVCREAVTLLGSLMALSVVFTSRVVAEIFIGMVDSTVSLVIYGPVH